MNDELYEEYEDHRAQIIFESILAAYMDGFLYEDSGGEYGDESMIYKAETATIGLLGHLGINFAKVTLTEDERRKKQEDDAL